jgi:hypothetical protein
MRAHGASSLQIDILYFEGCPNHPPATKLVHDVVRSLGLDAIIGEIEVLDSREAIRLRFLGSPTIHVNGKDIEPAAKGRTDYSITCRMYRGSGNLSRELLEEALYRELGLMKAEGGSA